MGCTERLSSCSNIRCPTLSHKRSRCPDRAAIGPEKQFFMRRKNEQAACRLLVLVRLKGLEPARLSTREPKSRMSTNSITGAYLTFLLCRTQVTFYHFTCKKSIAQRWGTWYHGGTRIRVSPQPGADAREGFHEPYAKGGRRPGSVGIGPLFSLGDPAGPLCHGRPVLSAAHGGPLRPHRLPRTGDRRLPGPHRHDGTDPATLGGPPHLL